MASKDWRLLWALTEREIKSLEDSAVIAGERLIGAKLQGVRLTRCDLGGAILTYTRLDRAVLTDCTIEKTSAEGVKWHDATLSGCSFRGSAVGGGGWRGARLERCDFRDAHLGSGRWDGAIARDCDFADVTFFHSDLAQATFIGCNLRGALMAKSRLNGTVFERCDLRGVDLKEAELDGTTFRNCAMHGVHGEPLRSSSSTYLDIDLSPEADGLRLCSGVEASKVVEGTEEPVPPPPEPPPPAPPPPQSHVPPDLATRLRLLIRGGAPRREALGRRPLVLTDSDALMGGKFDFPVQEGVQLTRCDLRWAEIGPCELRKAQFVDCNFDQALLNRTNFISSTFVNCSFRGARLEYARWTDGLRMERCDFSGCDAVGGMWWTKLLDDCLLRDCRFTGAWLGDASFQGTIIACDFRDSMLQSASFSYTSLSYCDLRGARIAATHFGQATFQRCAMAGVHGRPVKTVRTRYEEIDLSPEADGRVLLSGKAAARAVEFNPIRSP